MMNALEKLIIPLVIITATGLATLLYGNTLTLTEVAVSMNHHSETIERMGITISKLADTKYSKEDGRELADKVELMNLRITKLEAVNEIKR